MVIFSTMDHINAPVDSSMLVAEVPTQPIYDVNSILMDSFLLLIGFIKSIPDKVRLSYRPRRYS